MSVATGQLAGHGRWVEADFVYIILISIKMRPHGALQIRAEPHYPFACSLSAKRQTCANVGLFYELSTISYHISFVRSHIFPFFTNLENQSEGYVGSSVKCIHLYSSINGVPLG